MRGRFAAKNAIKKACALAEIKLGKCNMKRGAKNAKYCPLFADTTRKPFIGQFCVAFGHFRCLCAPFYDKGAQ
ncbi:hypothetical protein GCM10009129_02540 [Psychrobacter aestuarii]|uniref:Uncharacterized protein n=1 Tax=Psychrobacter aestuarii TaxID=556327 RepID=A0ABN0VKJ9_9GAMM